MRTEVEELQSRCGPAQDCGDAASLEEGQKVLVRSAETSQQECGTGDFIGGCL